MYFTYWAISGGGLWFLREGKTIRRSPHLHGLMYGDNFYRQMQKREDKIELGKETENRVLVLE